MPIENDADEPEGLDEEMEAPPESEEEGSEASEGEGQEVDVVTIGDEAAPASGDDAPSWVRDLRKRTRELERENAELKKGAKPQTVEIGPKPTIAGCDYDEDKFEAEFNAWTARKSAVDRAKADAETQQTEAQKAYDADMATFRAQAATLKVADFADAEEEVTSTLSTTQQGLLISGAENKALLIYAIGRNPERLRSLAAIKDPVKFAFAAARLEKDLKVEKRKATTSPESVVRGSAPSTGSAQRLERLEAEAAKSGDRSKVIAYKRTLKKA